MWEDIIQCKYEQSGGVWEQEVNSKIWLHG